MRRFMEVAVVAAALAGCADEGYVEVDEFASAELRVENRSQGAIEVDLEDDAIGEAGRPIQLVSTGEVAIVAEGAVLGDSVEPRDLLAAITVRDAETSELLYLRRPVVSRDWLSVGEWVDGDTYRHAYLLVVEGGEARTASLLIDNQGAQGIVAVLEGLDERPVEAFVEAGEVTAVVDTSAVGATPEPRDLITGIEILAADTGTLLYERRPGSNDDWEARIDPDQPAHTDHVLTISELAAP
jgi:hypothetical protein